MSPPPKNEIGPDEVRALRGDLSRADFARKIGVTPLTVYRWELPDGAAEARRPRGTVAERLRRALTPEPPRVPSPASSDATPGVLDPEDAALVVPIFEAVMRAEFARVDDELMNVMVSGALRSHAGRALAQATLAIAHLFGRNEIRIAFTTLQPALKDADAGILPPNVEIIVRGVASLLFSSADGRLFDAGRANAQVLRGERIRGRDTTPDVLFLLRFGGALASLYAGSSAGNAMNAAKEALFETMDSVTEPLPRLLAEEYRAHHSMVIGHTAQTTRRFEEVARHARELGVATVEARSLAFQALRMTSEVYSPEDILRVALEAQHVAARARLAPGFHGLFSAKAAAEAHLRVGRFEDAERMLEHGFEAARGITFVPIPLVMPSVRLYELTGRVERMLDLSEYLGRTPSPVAQGTSALVRAWHEVMTTGSTETLSRVEQRLESSDPNPYFLQDTLVYGVGMRLFSDDLVGTRLAARKAQRVLDRFPSLIITGHLKRHIALVACREGRLSEAAALLEASLATFTLGGDVVEAARGRYFLARVAYEIEQPGSEVMVDASTRELEALKIVVKPEQLVFGAFDSRPPSSTMLRGMSPRAEGLLVPIERLSVRGITPAMLREELVAVIAEMFPGRGAVLQEIGTTGDARTVAERGDSGVPPAQWFELGDGLGGRFRFGLCGPLPDGAYEPMRLCATVAGLAFEVASLRNVAIEPEGHEIEAKEIPGLIAASSAMKRLRSEITRLGPSRATVILQGESGTGKEVVAKAIHELSSRAKGPYITFNCAAVPRELFEGQLFGYRRGAFTGATQDHPGVIRAAHGGTLFLDEIGELPLELQAKLLRFLENREIMPLGEARPLEVDVRTIAATHQDLGARVREGKFREDLYYRLQVVPLTIAPLRERPEDILALARHFVRTLTPEGGEPPAIAPDALVRLTSYPWPGNVRELRNAIERALAFAPLPRVLGTQHLRIAEGTLRPPRG